MRMRFLVIREVVLSRRPDIRAAQLRFRRPSTETSQHCAWSRAELQIPNWRSWIGEAEARVAKRVRRMVEYCILAVGEVAGG